GEGQHVLVRGGGGGVVPQHRGAHGITNQQHLDSRGLEGLRCELVVRGEHGERPALLLGLLQVPQTDRGRGGGSGSGLSAHLTLLGDERGGWSGRTAYPRRNGAFPAAVTSAHRDVPRWCRSPSRRPGRRAGVTTTMRSILRGAAAGAGAVALLWGAAACTGGEEQAPQPRPTTTSAEQPGGPAEDPGTGGPASDG